MQNNNTTARKENEINERLKIKKCMHIALNSLFLLFYFFIFIFGYAMQRELYCMICLLSLDHVHIIVCCVCCDGAGDMRRRSKHQKNIYEMSEYKIVRNIVQKPFSVFSFLFDFLIVRCWSAN